MLTVWLVPRDDRGGGVGTFDTEVGTTGVEEYGAEGRGGGEGTRAWSVDVEQEVTDEDPLFLSCLR